jgi:hypothetical protein
MPGCKYVLKQGTRNGERCGRKRVRGSRNCSHHSDNKERYIKIINSTKKYNSFLQKIESLINDNVDLLGNIYDECEELQKELFGIRIFLEPTVIHEDSPYSDNYIPYEENHLHNALKRKATIKKKLKELKLIIGTIRDRLVILRTIQPDILNDIDDID